MVQREFFYLYILYHGWVGLSQNTISRCCPSMNESNESMWRVALRTNAELEVIAIRSNNYWGGMLETPRRNQSGLCMSKNSCAWLVAQRRVNALH
jgi:hypothetical protein